MKLKNALLIVVSDLKSRNNLAFAKEVFAFADSLDEKQANIEILSEAEPLISWFVAKNKEITGKIGYDWDTIKAALVANTPSKDTNLATTKKLLVMFIKTLSGLEFIDASAKTYLDKLKVEAGKLL